MADCNKNIYKSSGCDDFEVGDGNITFEQCGDRIGTFSLDQCHDETIEIPCPCDGKLSFHVDGDKQFEFTANQCYDTNYNLDRQTITDAINWKDFPICDSCIKWCNGNGTVSRSLTDCEGCGDKSGSADSRGYHEVTPTEGEYAFGVFRVNHRKMKLIKFWSDSCGICAKMSHYDGKVAEQLGFEFHSVNEFDDELWDKWVHVAEPLYEDTDAMGWPTYILVDHVDETDFVVLGEVLGGSDKGSFRKKILELINLWNYGETRADCKEGSGADSGGNCKDEICRDFIWDCTPNDVKLCAGGCYDMYASTHGCNGSDAAGTSLEYRWLVSEPGSSDYKVVQNWSRNVRYTQHTAEDAKVGKKYNGKIQARCNDFAGCARVDLEERDIRAGVERVYDAGDILAYKFEIEIKQCGKQCPGDQFVSFDNCPGQPKKAGSEWTLTANCDGVANSACTFKWFKGGTTNGELIKEGGRNCDVTFPNTEGNSQKYTVQAIWNNDTSCKSVATCTLTARTSSKCSSDSDCPKGFECVNGECEEKPECTTNQQCKDKLGTDCAKCTSQGTCQNLCGSGEKCVNGKCEGDPDPIDPPPSSNDECKDGACKNSWWIDWECVARKIKPYL